MYFVFVLFCLILFLVYIRVGFDSAHRQNKNILPVVVIFVVLLQPFQAALLKINPYAKLYTKLSMSFDLLSTLISETENLVGRFL